MKNQYIKLAKTTEVKFRQILKCFSFDLMATHTAELTKYSRNAINRFYTLFREKITDISKYLELADKVEIEVDKSYF